MRPPLWSLARLEATMQLPSAVPCFVHDCKGRATFEAMEEFPRDARPVYSCQCGARIAVPVEELPEYLAEYA